MHVIAPQIRALLDQAEATDLHAASCTEMLDATFDLHNDLTDWACNTEHATAAAEVMEILEKYARLKRTPVDVPTELPAAASGA